MILLAVLTCAAFWPVRTLEFIAFDDEVYVTQNARVQAGLTVRNILWAFTAMRPVYWHPLTWMSHMLDVECFGLDPAGPHLVNLLVHLANTLLLFHLLQRLTGSTARSLIVAALFAVHPLGVESVAWVPERKNVLSTFFWFASIRAYAGYVSTPSRMGMTCVLSAFGLGLMSKPMIVTLPVTLLLIDLWPPGRWSSDRPDGGSAADAKDGAGAADSSSSEFRRIGLRALEKWPLFLMSAVIAGVTWIAQRLAGAVSSLGQLPIGLRLENALVSYVKYMGMALWPHDLAVFYPYPTGGFPLWQPVAAAAALTGVTVLVWRLRRYGYLPFGWFWYLITLVPVIGIVQVGTQALADRHTYVPLVGIYIMVVWGLADWAKQRPEWRVGLTVLAIFAIGALAICTRLQLNRWLTSETLYRYTLSVTRNNALVENNLGSVLAQDGRWDEAEDHIHEALRIFPGYALAHGNLGNVYFGEKKLDSAVEEFKTAIRLDSGMGRAHKSMGIVLSRKEDGEGAMREYAEALRIDPDDAISRKNLGVELAQAGRPAAARMEFERVVAANDRDSDAHFNLALTLVRLGDASNAMVHYERAIKIDPHFDRAYYNLGLLQAGEGNHRAAIRNFDAALRQRPGDSHFLNNFGVSLARIGELESAAEQFREAIRIDTGNLEARCNLAAVRLAQGKKSAALDEVLEVLYRNPKHPKALEMLQTIER